jgi:hypothetical protein
MTTKDIVSMTFTIDKDHIRWGTANHWNLIYIWWGINPWSEYRTVEIGFGFWSKQILRFK